MTSYSGLVSSNRESVSLDEDDLSDVEDEVFIRDGRNGYKLAEERGVKRPLMAPRRKLGKPEFSFRLKNRTSCKVFCIPCCYALAALTIFLGLIVLVIILVSLFPLPLDKLKEWILSKTGHDEKNIQILPCTDLEVSDVWSFNLPKLATESPMRTVDVNNDGVEDIIFGYGLGEDISLPQQWFCPMFFGVKPPCQGGLIALDGSTGQPIWRRWLQHMVFTLFCNADLNGDGILDCLASGKGGVLCLVSGKDGSIIWEFQNNKTSLVLDVYAGSFIPDQDGDNVVDIIASHTVQGTVRSGYLLIISGKTGLELVRVPTPNNSEIYYPPQLFVKFDGENAILFGTGGQNSPGGLYLVSLHDIVLKALNPVTLYVDPYKGIMNPAILVDINGDKHEDIVCAMFNSTVAAFDGISLTQIWNYSIENSETLSVPTPGYFNSDNVTDFLVKYQTGAGFPVYYYSQTFIIDGKTGKPMYREPIIDSVGTQVGGLTISMENYGNDLFLYWNADCKFFEGRQDKYNFVEGTDILQNTRADLCKLRFNSTMTAKLFALNQYNEPPGILLYSSENRTFLEYNGTKMPLDEVKEYLLENPGFDITFRNTNSQSKIINNPTLSNFNNDYKEKFDNSGSSFRHRDDGQGLIKDFSRDDIRPYNEQVDNKYDYVPPDDPWSQTPQEDDISDYDSFPDETERSATNIKPRISDTNNRDPRSKFNGEPTPSSTNDGKSKKKNLSDPNFGPNDYQNINMARNRLLHDLNDLPSDILRDTFIQNFEKDKNNKFEERDLRHRESEDEDGRTKKSSSNPIDILKQMEHPESLWDLESEKELEDRENGYWRGKRQAENIVRGIPKITSTGVLLKPLTISNSQSAIDVVFATYWLLPKYGPQIVNEKDLLCIEQKINQAKSPNDKYHSLEKSSMQDLFTKLCLEERGVELKNNYRYDTINDHIKNSPYFNELSQLILGQMTVYRLRLECKCQILKPDERCANILNADDQSWSAYMGKEGDGFFRVH